MTGKPDPMAEIRASFFVECEELLESLQDALTALDEGDDDPETINVAFRAVHSIKGGAGAFGLNALVSFAHRFETVMDAVRSGRMTVESQGLKLFFLVADRLADHVAAARTGGDAPTGSEEAIAALEDLIGGAAAMPEPEEEVCDFVPMTLSLSLDLPTGLPSDQPSDLAGTGGAGMDRDEPAGIPPAVAPFDRDGGGTGQNRTGPASTGPASTGPASTGPGGAGPASTGPGGADAAAPSPEGWIVRFTPLAGLYASGNEPLYLLRALAELGEVEIACDLGRVPNLSTLDPGEGYLGWTVRLAAPCDPAQIHEVFEFVEDVATVEVLPLVSEGPERSQSRLPSRFTSPSPGAGGNAAGADAAAEPSAIPAGVAAAPVSTRVQADPATDAARPATARPPQTHPVRHDNVSPVPATGTSGSGAPQSAMPGSATPGSAPPASAASGSAGPASAPPPSAPPPSATPGSTPPASATPGSAAPGSEAQSATVRVDVERIDKLVNLVGELVINQAMLQQSIAAAGLGRDSTVMNGLESFMMLTRDIQDSVMVIRAQPVKPLFQRMARIVREASALVGKTVRLKTEGDATEVDKTVIERLADPLTHMIRNAVDHGLEPPDRRIAAGKPLEGVITLRAQHRSGRVVIDVADDGGGIDRERVLSIARSKGLVAADAELSDGEIDNLLFLPGFSTASTVSNLSGRGVGMDVVRRAIQALGGRITIETKRGEGTCFSISLPLTLAVLDGMIVKAAGETLVVPLSSIVETAVLEPDQLRPIGASTNVIHIRGDFVPLLDLGAELGYRARQTTYDSGIILLTTLESGERAALIVDEIVEQRQVVIKGLHHAFGQIPGIAAATILGDGQIALILDPADLVAGAGGRQRPAYMALAG